MLSRILNRIAALPDCTVFPPSNLPKISQSHVLPQDVSEFYTLCGGAIMFAEAPFPLEISTPDEFVVANNKIWATLSQEIIEASRSDRSWNWYIIGEYPIGHYITISLDRFDNGYCYNSHYLLHPGDSYKIASSLTDLLRQVVRAKGEFEIWDN